MARVVLHEENLELIRYAPLLRDLAEDVADDARRIAPVRTGDLKSTIRVGDVDDDHAEVLAGGLPGAATGELVDYPVYVETGTRHMSAQPYLRPALYRFRGAR